MKQVDNIGRMQQATFFFPVVIKILAVKVTRFVKKNTTQTQVQINFPTILFRFLHKSDQK